MHRRLRGMDAPVSKLSSINFIHLTNNIILKAVNSVIHGSSQTNSGEGFDFGGFH